MRIVAGEFKGRRLAGPEGAVARPTSDKVREAVFSILGDVSGARVLDLFAGTGALGLEALSRGAAEVVLVERDRRMAGVARRNIAQTAGEHDARVRLVRGDALRFLAAETEGRIDLALLDPPYAQSAELAPKLSASLVAALAPSAVVVTESERRSPLDLDENVFALRSEHRYGDTLIRIYDAP